MSCCGPQEYETEEFLNRISDDPSVASSKQIQWGRPLTEIYRFLIQEEETPDHQCPAKHVDNVSAQEMS